MRKRWWYHRCQGYGLSHAGRVKDCHMNLLRIAILAFTFSLSVSSAAAQPAGPRTDRHGDPLPGGALQRLGTVHYRQEVRIDAFAFAPDGQTYATAANTPKDATVRLWHTATGKEIRRCSGAPNDIVQVAFAPDGQTVVAACRHELVFWDVGSGTLLRQFQGHPGGIGCLALSPDGKMLAVGGDLARQEPGHSIRLLDAATGKLIRVLDKHETWINVVAFSPDGKRLASSSTDLLVVEGTKTRVLPGFICVWDVQTGEKLHQLNHAGPSLFHVFDGRSNVAFSPDLSRAVFEGPNKYLEVWDIAAAKKLWDIPAVRRSFAFAPDGKTLLVGAESEPIRVYDAVTGKPVRVFADTGGHGRNIIGIDPRGQYLATIAADRARMGLVRLWDLASGQELTGKDVHQDGITLAQLTADGKHVVTGGQDGSVRLWDSGTGQQVKRLIDYRGSFSGIALARDGKTLAYIDKEGAFRLLDLPVGKARPGLAGTDSASVGLVLSPDGLELASCTAQGDVLLWDTQSGAKLRTLTGGASEMCFTPDGRLLTGGGGNLQLWQAGSGRELFAFTPPPLDPSQSLTPKVSYWMAAFSPDGRWLAASVSDIRNNSVVFRLCVWEVASGRLLRQFLDLPHPAWAITFTPDGSTLVTATGTYGNEVDPSATFWDLGSGALLGRMEGHLGNVTTVAFAPDGRAFFTGGTDGTVLVWDAAALPRAKRPTPRKLTQAELDELWVQLAGSDASTAYQAIMTITAGGKDSVAFLQEHLEPARLLTPAQLEQAIADLNAERYAVRAKASALLATQGEYAAQALRKVLKLDGITLETRRRVELLLPRLEKFEVPPAELRALRALVVLERIGDPQARKVIEVLAGGTPGARLTQQAQAALVWLGKRKG
jgi:WD40 repeat protein